MSSSELEDWLTLRVAAVTGVPLAAVSRDVPFSSLGLDSVSKAGLAREIEKKVQRQVDSDFLFTHDSIAAVLEALAG